MGWKAWEKWWLSGSPGGGGGQWQGDCSAAQGFSSRSLRNLLDFVLPG